MEQPQSVSTPSSSLDRSIADNSALNQPSPAGMGNFYLFKSWLQEYAQKAGSPTPVYQTLKEEQSAAEVALMELHKLGQMTEIIPVCHETGLCKNLLQEYAQKMNYAIPYYKCNRQEEGAHPFICTVEIGVSSTLVVQPEQRKKQRSKRQELPF